MKSASKVWVFFSSAGRQYSDILNSISVASVSEQQDKGPREEPSIALTKPAQAHVPYGAVQTAAQGLHTEQNHVQKTQCGTTGI